MEDLIIDTNVITKYLKSSEGVLGDILGQYKLKISSATTSELLASSRAGNQVVHSQITEFLQQNFEVIPVSQDIAIRTGDLLRELDITLGHATIAATAIVLDLPLLTYEIKTFDRIPDLKLVDI